MKKIVLIMLFILFGFMSVGCDEATADDAALDISIFSESSVDLGGQLEIKVDPDKSLREVTWSLVYESGAELRTCDSFSTPIINCTFEEGGEAEIKLVGKTFDGEEINLRKSIAVNDMDLPANQSPDITVALASDSSEGGVVSTMHAREEGVLNFPLNEEVTFDFSATTDDVSSVDELTYEVDLGTGYKIVEKVFTHTFTEVGQFVIKVRVTDPDKNVTEKTFMAYISCRADEYELVVDGSKVTITDDPTHNYFTYDASGAVSGGSSENYRYKWDFNGDDILDSDWLESPSVREYNIFRGMRDVKLKVWDMGCHYVKQVDLGELDPPAHDFNLPFADGVPETLQGPQIPGYYFLQAHINGLEGFESRYTDVDVIATKSFTASDEEQWRVLCDYRKSSNDLKKATFTINGRNRYEREDQNGEYHGFRIKVTDIDDPMGTFDITPEQMTSSIRLENPGGTIESVSYMTDEGYDKLKRIVYRKVDDCDVDLVLEAFPLAEGACENNPKAAYSIIIDGTYSCPKLKGNTDGKFIEITTGAFYCEVGKVDACVGGGGGGGGGIPPEER